MEIFTEAPSLVLEPSTSCIRTEICSIASVRRVAAMLDLEPDTYSEDTPLPRGWQFILMAADTRRSSLRADGFPGLGVTMPDLGIAFIEPLEHAGNFGVTALVQGVVGGNGEAGIWRETGQGGGQVHPVHRSKVVLGQLARA